MTDQIGDPLTTYFLDQKAAPPAASFGPYPRRFKRAQETLSTAERVRRFLCWT